MEEDSLVVCSKCGNIHCLTVLMGDELINEGRRFQRNNDVSCEHVRLRWRTMFTREMYGILGKNNRVRACYFGSQSFKTQSVNSVF